MNTVIIEKSDEEIETPVDVSPELITEIPQFVALRKLSDHAALERLASGHALRFLRQLLFHLTKSSLVMFNDKSMPCFKNIVYQPNIKCFKILDM